ncbi:hypothetical protein CPB84DRAFT_1763143 [Gymnopilus junonius]|uniref:EH domain-containing protein n=1 Tax=Gymnopilus junonius TaxID=109634 RepID=A0A9P5P1G7_GYMJU|nr:hypothetical protein CPB84DRAFT_1763143 [Gymnopilus junonius]
MPSTSIQARINAFESLSNNAHNNGDNKTDVLETVPIFARPPPSPSPSPPNLGRKTSLIDLKDWVVDDGPSLIDSTKTPTQQAFSNAKIMNGSANTGPLINLDSSPPKPKPKPKPANLSTALNKKPPPQLSARRSSYTSLKSLPSSSSTPFVDSLTVEHAHRYPPLTVDLSARSNTAANHAPSSSISSFHSVSLSSDTDPSTPGSVANFIATFPVDEDPHLPRRDADSISLTESYEEVSTSSLASPATERLINLDWERASSNRKPMPPKLPQRPSSTKSPVVKSTPPPSHPVSRTASASSSSPTSPIIRPSSSSTTLSSAFHTPPYTPRRSAPPPPSSRASDRSSIQSTTTIHSFSSSSNSHQSRNANPSLLSLKIRRPTPVPLAARKRYEAVFNANILQRRRVQKLKQEEKPALLSPGEARGRRAVGWRGLSVDLVTCDDMTLAEQQSREDKDSNMEEAIGSNDKLEGAIIKLIWKRSGLENAQLAEIWNECDLTGQGALSMEGFVKGMWRIDEELRRAQSQALKSAKSLGNLSDIYRSNSTLGHTPSVPKIPPKPKSRDILR